ncbi:MAG: hypothetical protein IJZ80_06290, partial [Clostridia bacterium]|nr:hypothetical protein [Clostridia bacterium]
GMAANFAILEFEENSIEKIKNLKLKIWKIIYKNWKIEEETRIGATRSMRVSSLFLRHIPKTFV